MHLRAIAPLLTCAACATGEVRTQDAPAPVRSAPAASAQAACPPPSSVTPLTDHLAVSPIGGFVLVPSPSGCTLVFAEEQASRQAALVAVPRDGGERRVLTSTLTSTVTPAGFAGSTLLYLEGALGAATLVARDREGAGDARRI